ncbi:hypothetical protein B0H15DRAFT_926395 [Mycena belliarum]|uniref:Uncharacterized protein n=1 Tax=Mycena belliarum TaxID=1033014 RepID=A0AAD6XWV1_9AGAR|nr:hypothetical protein B0H15DRAFT_926395 [Mycena belliae]
MARTTPPPPSNPMNNEATPSGTGAAPSVLGLYEATASEQRGAYMQLLQPTDRGVSEHHPFPLELESAPATGVRAPPRAGSCNAPTQRSAKNIPPGASQTGLADKLVHLTATARPKTDENLKQQVLTHAKVESDPEARSIDGRYWLVRLADRSYPAVRADAVVRRQRRAGVLVRFDSRLELAVLENCFIPDGLPTAAALLPLVRSASLHQLGYNPLFVYAFTSPPPDFLLDDAIPTEVVAPVLRVPRESSQTDERSPEAKISTPVVVKLCYISERRQWREKVVVDALYAADPLNAPSKAPCGVRCADPSSDRVGSLRILAWDQMLFTSPPNGRKLPLLSAAQLLSAAEQLFAAILDAFRHRDVSVNNILLADTQLFLIDWEMEMGRGIDEPGSVVGTLDTMSVASLGNDGALPHDGVEAAVYVLLKVLTQIQKYVPSADSKAEWEKNSAGYCRDKGDLAPGVLQSVSGLLWHQFNPLLSATPDILKSSGHDSCANFISPLLSLPLPATRWGPHMRRGIDASVSNHDDILVSLAELAKAAIGAVRAVDVGNFGKSWERGDKNEWDTIRRR